MKKKVLVFILTLINFSLSAQQKKVVQDFGIWTGVNLEKKFSDNYELGINQQIRTFENSSRLESYLLNLNLKYSINEKFNLGGDLRYTHAKKRVSARENNFRYSVDLSYKKEVLKKLDIQYRLSFQKDYTNFYTNLYYRLSDLAYQNDQSSTFRNRLKATFEKNKKTKLYVSGELFRAIELFREPYFKKYRTNIGCSKKIKSGKIDFSIGYEKELNSNYPFSFWYLNTEYIIKL